jgi:hypothetical protein
VDELWSPSFHLRDRDGVCCLTLVGVGTGRGKTLQDAADDLILTLLNLVAAVRMAGMRIPGELGPPDLRLVRFLHELGEIAARGGDIGERVFGLQTGLAA